ncbi:MAG TPA: hypothetical protein V6D23_16680 [Candidatus Obscuribacterales bacterium]
MTKVGNQGTGPIQQQSQTGRTNQGAASASAKATTGSSQAQVPARAGDSQQTGAYAQGSIEPRQVSFGSSSGDFDVAAAIADLRGRFVVDGKVPASKAEQLQDAVDGLFANPAARKALIEHFSLHSPPNQNALVAVTAVESGDNGDMGEVMSAVMNRTLAKNLLSEMTGRRDRYSIQSTVNESGQFSSKKAVNNMLRGRDTPSHHLANFGPDAREVLKKVLAGQSRFSHDASGTYFFNQGGFPAGTDFKVGVHHYSDRNSRDTSYVGSVLHDFGKLNWNQ